MSEQGEVVNAPSGGRPGGPRVYSTKFSAEGVPARRAPHAIMYLYPWDLYEHGVDRVLDDLESFGIDAVQLSFSYHVATFLTPRAPNGRVRFGEQGALQFDPAVLQVDWPLEPPVAAEVTGPDYIAALLAAIAGRGLDTIAWVVYLYNHTLARSRPDLAAVNAYGDRHAAQLCPANPTVRAYAKTLTTAVLEHAPLGGLVAESLSFLPYDYGFLNLKAAVDPGRAASRLLSLCFCEHCATRAGTSDVAGLRRQVADVIDAELAGLPDEGGAEATQAWCDDSEALAEYLGVRADTASSLQREVLAMARGRGLRTGSNSAEGQDATVTGVANDAIRSSRSEFRFEVLPGWDEERMARAVATASEAAGPHTPVYALAQLSNFTSESSFVATLEAVKQHGVDRFRLYEYGLLSANQLSWLANAKHIWSRTDDGSGGGGYGRDVG